MADGVNGKPYKPFEIAEQVARNLQVQTWRDKIAEEERTFRWKHIFDKIEPDRETIVDMTAIMMNITSGSVSPHYLFSLMLATWTYGYAAALSDLADENITLWEGEPLDFPDWENEVPEPPTDIPPEPRDDKAPPSPKNPEPGGGVEATPPVEQKALVPVTGGTYEDYGH